MSEALLKRIDAKLTALLNQPKKQTWVGVGFVKMLTGFNKEQLRAAREQDVIKFRKNGDAIEYLLESIPEVFIKKQTEAI